MWFVIAVVLGFAVLIIGLTIVQFRAATPLAFRCTRCSSEFQQPPHKDFPGMCPKCRARDWAAPQ